MNNIKGYWTIQGIGLLITLPIIALLGLSVPTFIAGYVMMGIVGMMVVCR